MGKTPRPICDLCNQKVEEMEIETVRDGLLITVRCHGEQTSFTLSNSFAASMNKNTEIGRVFVREKITDGRCDNASGSGSKAKLEIDSQQNQSSQRLPKLRK